MFLLIPANRIRYRIRISVKVIVLTIHTGMGASRAVLDLEEPGGQKSLAMASSCIRLDVVGNLLSF